MNFRTRSNQPELLDGNDIPFEDIRRNMRELDIINSWLGGHAITAITWRLSAAGLRENK